MEEQLGGGGSQQHACARPLHAEMLLMRRMLVAYCPCAAFLQQTAPQHSKQRGCHPQVVYVIAEVGGSSSGRHHVNPVCKDVGG